MTQSVDLDALASYLASDRAPDGCMDISELDGFMAGLLSGPQPIAAEEWLAMVWDGDQPQFADAEERAQVLTTIGSRFQEISAGLDASPPTYSPVFWEDIAGTTITEDWAAGFMQAVALRPRAWELLLAQDDSAALLIPIAAVAGQALPADAGGDLDLPEPMLDRMIREADSILPECVIRLRDYWRRRGVTTWSEAPAQRPH